ncbi:hypothetical protein T08_3002 [Trichinella sp. T8]|nr:hypothetical protein T08_3002 [Trichinella sp. T8]
MRFDDRETRLHRREKNPLAAIRDEPLSIPSVHTENVIKAWTRYDAKTSYAWNMQIYTGKRSSGFRDKNQDMRVVLDLTVGLKGNSITEQYNFFTFRD